jgi:hypothetical protein
MSTLFADAFVVVALLILQRWVAEPNVSTTVDPTMHKSLKRQRRSDFRSAPPVLAKTFAGASGLLQTVSPAVSPFVTAMNVAL